MTPGGMGHVGALHSVGSILEPFVAFSGFDDSWCSGKPGHYTIGCFFNQFVHTHSLYNTRIFPSSKQNLYKCIGASDKILDHCLSLNSAATTPFNLVPMGSPDLWINTQALSSNLTTLPSGLWYFFAVRTTTACRTSPRRTLFAALIPTLPPDSGPKFRCFWTTTTMRSPSTGSQPNDRSEVRRIGESTYQLWRVS